MTELKNQRTAIGHVQNVIKRRAPQRQTTVAKRLGNENGGASDGVLCCGAGPTRTPNDDVSVVPTLAAVTVE